MFLVASNAEAGDVLSRIRAAGTLRCGVVAEPEDWNKVQLHGNMAVFDGEICRALGAALFGRDKAVAISSFNVEEEALQAVHAGKIDVAVGVTPNVSARARNQVQYSPPLFFDTLSVIVHRVFNIKTFADLAGKKLCAVDGTDSEALTEWALAARHIKFIPFMFQEQGEMEDGLLTKHCQALAAPLSKLGQMRATYGARLADTAILPDALALLPLNAAYATTDPDFAAIVDATVAALAQAEEAGFTMANAAGWKDDGNVAHERLAGIDPSAANALGLPKDWVLRMVAIVGNYGEIYDRTVGTASPLGLPRGLNALWTNGGLLAPDPVR